MKLNHDRLFYPLKININFKLNAEIETTVKAMNKVLVNSSYNEIDFSQSHLPHITLLMGLVHTADRLDNIAERIELFAKDEKVIRYQLSSPYWKKPSRKFCFIDTNPQSEFLHFRTKLFETIEDLIKCEFHGGPNNPSHITVGYAEPDFMNLDELNALMQDSTSTASQIRICVAGNRGTCHQTLFAAELQNN